MTPHHFAIVPAAGNSARMGRPKLLLPLNGRPLIAHVIEAWERSSVDRILIVVRPDDEALAKAVKSKVQSPKSKVEAKSTLDIGPWTLDSSACRVDFVIPASPPADMKASIQAALKHIEQRFSPSASDGFLVAPGDMPRLSPAIIDRLIQRHLAEPGAKIFVPTIGGRRGHPTLFSWPLAAEVHRLAFDQGLNCIVDGQQPAIVSCEDLIAEGEYPFADIDTPEEYNRMTKYQ